MAFEVIRAFRHKNTGKLWLAGEVFDGTPAQARELARRGFVMAAGGVAEKREPVAAGTSSGPADGTGAKPLADMTVKELVAICARELIETPSKPRKADLIAAIEAARKGQ